MDKVQLKKGNYKGIKKLLFLKDYLIGEDLRIIVDWCNKNLTDNVFIGKCEFGRSFETIDSLDEYYDYLQGYHSNPIFVFTEKSDMMAFKLRWSDFVITRKEMRLSWAYD